MSDFPKESGWWWVRICGQPTVVKAMFQCQELWPEDMPAREVVVMWPCGAGDFELGFMNKETGELTDSLGNPRIHQNLEWVKPIPWDNVPNQVCTQEQIDALATV